MFFFFKQKTAYEMRISDWSSDVCSSDLLDGATGDGVYTLPFDIGKRSRFGGIETTGDLAFDAEHVEVLARFKRGDLYDSRMVDDLRQALVAKGLFATVAAEPQPTRESACDDTEYVTTLGTPHAAPPPPPAASTGQGTGERARTEERPGGEERG